MSPTISPVLVLPLLLLSPAAAEEAIDPFALIRETLKYWRRLYKMYQEEVALGYCWAEYFLQLGQTARNPPSAQSLPPNVANFQINRGNLFASTRNRRFHELIVPEHHSGTEMNSRRTVTLLEHCENQCDSEPTKGSKADHPRRNMSYPPRSFKVAEISEKDENSVLAPLTTTRRIAVVTNGNSPAPSLVFPTKSREVTDQRSWGLAKQDGGDGQSSSLKQVAAAPFVLEFTGIDGGPVLGWISKGPEADTGRKVLHSRGSDGTSGFKFSLAHSRPKGLESVLSSRRVVFVGDSRLKGYKAMETLDDYEGRVHSRRKRTGDGSNAKSWGERRLRVLGKRHRKPCVEPTSKNQGFHRNSLAFVYESPIWKRRVRKEGSMRREEGSWRTRNDLEYFLETGDSFSLGKKGFWPRGQLTNTGGNNWESLKQLLPKDNRYRIRTEGVGEPVRYPSQGPSLLAVTRQRFIGDYGSPTSGMSRNSIQSRSSGDQGRRSSGGFVVARGLARMPGIFRDLRMVLMAFLRVLRMTVQLGWDVVDYIDTNTALACTKDYLVGKTIEWIDS